MSKPSPARFIDLSASIANSPEGTPEPLKTRLQYAGHAQGAAEIEQLFGVDAGGLRNGEGWATESLTQLGTHSTTHVDAPLHYNSMIGGQPAQSIDELPLEWFHAPGVKLDFHDRADGEVIGLSDVQGALRASGHHLQPLDIVLIQTGRDQFLAAPDYLFRGPGVSAEATLWLYDQGVRVMGIDAWGWDAPLNRQAQQAGRPSQPGIFWAAHQIDRAYSQIERLVNLHLLPASGFTVICFPLKIQRGSAGPARVVAMLDK